MQTCNYVPKLVILILTKTTFSTLSHIFMATHEIFTSMSQNKFCDVHKLTSVAIQIRHIREIHHNGGRRINETCYMDVRAKNTPISRWPIPRGASMNRIPTHVGFSDESHTDQVCWTSIGMVTMKNPSLAQMEKALCEQLQSTETKSEIKWTNTTKGWRSDAARVICYFVVKKAAKHELRIDTIMVDKKYMINANRKENVSKIYYQLFKNVLEYRWGREHVWNLYPDKNKSIWWKEMKYFLERGSEQWLKIIDGIELCKMFDVHHIRSMDSQSNIFLQVADIFVGMAIFSRSHYNKYEAWHGLNQTLNEILADQEGEFDADTRWALSWFEQFRFDKGDFGVAETLSRAKNTSMSGMAKAGILESKTGKVRLLLPSELPEDWDPKQDKRFTLWEAAHHLMRLLEKSESVAAKIMAKIGSRSETARELTYRLYHTCEQKKYAKEAQDYNSLIQSWHEIARLSRKVTSQEPTARGMKTYDDS